MMFYAFKNILRSQNERAPGPFKKNIESLNWILADYQCLHWYVHRISIYPSGKTTHNLDHYLCGKVTLTFSSFSICPEVLPSPQTEMAKPLNSTFQTNPSIEIIL